MFPSNFVTLVQAFDELGADQQHGDTHCVQRTCRPGTHFVTRKYAFSGRFRLVRARVLYAYFLGAYSIFFSLVLSVCQPFTIDQYFPSSTNEYGVF